MAVFVNNVEIPESDQARIREQHGLSLPPGRFWYDRLSGAWGLDGTPALGMTRPGLDLGGPLPEDATVKKSGILGFLNRSRIYINGRELAPTEAQWLAQVLLQGRVMLWPGRYAMDAQGNIGPEGGQPQVNLPQLLASLQAFAAMQQAFGGQGGAGQQGYQRATAGGYIGSDGQTSYFFDPSSGASVMTGG